jgi:hypothetical protein
MPPPRAGNVAETQRGRRDASTMCRMRQSHHSKRAWSEEVIMAEKEAKGSIPVNNPSEKARNEKGRHPD